MTPLPVWMAFDVDENKAPDFKRLFPDYRCYEIHDALDIRRPQVITTNPRSWNCQYVYEMLWTDQDMDRPAAAMVEYERIRKELSLLFGADPRFVNHVVRSPMYIAGHQRKNPEREVKGKNGRVRTIDLDAQPLWHHSVWYEPHGYTLVELRELVAELRELHEMLGNEVPAAVMVTVPATSREETKPNGYAIPYARQQELAVRSASTVQVGERNDWLFSRLAVNHGRPNVNRFKGTNSVRAQSKRDYTGFTNFLMLIAKRLNSELHDPLDEGEVERTSQSIVKFLLSDRFNRHRTSDEATFINRHFRWGVDYVSKIQELADEQGIGYEAAKKRIQRNSSSPFLHDRDGDILKSGHGGQRPGAGREVDAEVEALLAANPDMKRATAQKRVQRARKAAVIKQQEPPQPIIVPELTPSQRRDIVNYRRLDWDDDRVAAALFLPVEVVAMVLRPR
jgi:hypothetical protein